MPGLPPNKLSVAASSWELGHAVIFWYQGDYNSQACSMWPCFCQGKKPQPISFLALLLLDIPVNNSSWWVDLDGNQYPKWSPKCMSIERVYTFIPRRIRFCFITGLLKQLLPSCMCCWLIQFVNTSLDNSGMNPKMLFLQWKMSSHYCLTK